MRSGAADPIYYNHAREDEKPLLRTAPDPYGRGYVFRGVATKYLPNYLVWFTAADAASKTTTAAHAWRLMNGAMVAA